MYSRSRVIVPCSVSQLPCHYIEASCVHGYYNNCMMYRIVRMFDYQKVWQLKIIGSLAENFGKLKSICIGNVMDILKLVKTWRIDVIHQRFLLPMFLLYGEFYGHHHMDISTLTQLYCLLDCKLCYYVVILGLSAIKIVFTSRCLAGFASDNHRDPLDSHFTELEPSRTFQQSTSIL